jgi:hypothetical protein
MAPKPRQGIEIEKTHRDPLLSFNQPVTADCSDFLGTALCLAAIGVFLLFGATMACLAGTTLVRPGTVLDRMWALDPRAYGELEPLGRTVGLAFLVLAVAPAAAGLGWFRRRHWGWQLAVGIFATQVLGDFVHILTGHIWQGAAGMTTAGAILLYIIQPSVRTAFSGKH